MNWVNWSKSRYNGGSGDCCENYSYFELGSCGHELVRYGSLSSVATLLKRKIAIADSTEIISYATSKQHRHEMIQYAFQSRLQALAAVSRTFFIVLTSAGWRNIVPQYSY
jgi:hypothetical protein